MKITVMIALLFSGIAYAGDQSGHLPPDTMAMVTAESNDEEPKQAQ
jgi:hypothetical protein